jgi:hypothetical protein
VPRDDPDSFGRLRRRDEDTTRFGDACFGNDQQRVPAFDPVRLAHRAQQREDLRGRTYETLRVTANDAIRSADVHQYKVEIAEPQV